jgi:hypothetical protein
MALPFFEQPVHNIDSGFQRPGERNPIEFEGAGQRPANLQRGWLLRDDLRDRSLALKYRDGLAAANRPKYLLR